jgi:hypothetical protein
MFIIFVAMFNIYKFYVCPHLAVMCFLWISELTVVISLHTINLLGFVTQAVCVYCAVETESWNIIQVILSL